MKKILTHKILPFLGVFLFIFNILLVGNVSAYKYNYPSTELNADVVEHIKSLEKYSNYSYCLAHVDLSTSSMGHLIHVYLFDRSDITFHCGTSGGWDAIKSSGSLDYYYYLLRVDNNFAILDQGIRSGQISNIITGGYGVGSGYSVWGNVNVYGNSLDDVWYSAIDITKYPYIYQDVGDIEVFRSGGIDIYSGDYSGDNTLVFSVYHVQGDSYSTMFSTELNSNSSYYFPLYSLDTGELTKHKYGIFYSSMGNFIVGDTYRFVLTYAKSNGLAGTDIRDVVIKGKSSEIGKETDEIKQEINSGFGELKVEFQESTNKIVESNNKTQEAIKENTETNKNIFQKIGDILNILNPFSENFFAYKLVDLFLNMLKGLFIPSDTFFSNYFSELNDWFSDRFGFLYYPLELFFDLCNRFLSINFNEPVINIPEIREPFTNTVFISATQFNFNTLLEQNSLKTVHDIYLVVVDAIIYIGLVILLYNKYEEVMTK